MTTFVRNATKAADAIAFSAFGTFAGSGVGASGCAPAAALVFVPGASGLVAPIDVSSRVGVKSVLQKQ